MVKTKKSKTSKTKKKSSSIEKILMENTIALQKVIVNLSSKINDLSNRISKLLELFEVSAKTLAERGSFENKEINEKINKILEQNKTIAQGLALMHERIPLSTQKEKREIQEEKKPEDLTEYQKSVPIRELTEKPKFKPLPK